MLSYTEPAVTPAQAIAYVTARGVEGWPTDEPAQAVLLRRGQDYIAHQYNDMWCVEFDDEDAPELVKFAIIEAAIIEMREPGLLSEHVDLSKRIASQSVDGASESYFPPGLSSGDRAFSSSIKGLLSGLLRQRQRFIKRA